MCVCTQSLSHVPLFATPIRLLSPWDSPDNTTGVSSHSFLQGIFPTQGSNPGLLHCRQILLNSLPFLLQGDLPDPGMELASCISRWIFFFFFLPLVPPGKPCRELHIVNQEFRREVRDTGIDLRVISCRWWSVL